MLELGVKALLAYLLGTLLGGLLLGRLRGVDIRSMGSGNAGATNALRTQGRSFGAAVLVIDVLKAVLAVAWLPGAALPGIPPDSGLSREWLSLACAGAVIVGHVYPVWFGFRGGKGVATVVGAVGALQPGLLLPLIACWLLILILTGYVGLASVLASVCLAAAVALRRPADLPLLWFCAAVAVFVAYTHRGNITRMWRGEEHRMRRPWLFRSRST